MGETPTNLLRRQLLAGLSVIAGAGACRALPARFPVFDALLHAGKPDLAQFGLQPLPAVADLWRRGADTRTVDPEGLRQAWRRLPRGTTDFFIDIENWPLLGTTPGQRSASIDKLIVVAQSARQSVQSARFGFYGIAPATTYWPLVEHRPLQRDDWDECNRQCARLAAVVDFSFPSLYTFYDDRNGWMTYARETIAAARRYGKPVYPFLWFEYHDSNPSLRNREIAMDAWREELQFCRAHADGVVLWGGYGRQWNNSAAWWQTVRAELRLPA